MKILWGHKSNGGGLPKLWDEFLNLKNIPEYPRVMSAIRKHIIDAKLNRPMLTISHSKYDKNTIVVQELAHPRRWPSVQYLAQTRMTFSVTPMMVACRTKFHFLSRAGKASRSCISKSKLTSFFFILISTILTP